VPLCAVVNLRTVVLTALTIMNNRQKLNNNFLDNHGGNLSYDGHHERGKRGVSSLAIVALDAQFGVVAALRSASSWAQPKESQALLLRILQQHCLLRM
jgi:hypothetical protein